MGTSERGIQNTNSSGKSYHCCAVSFHLLESKNDQNDSSSIMHTPLRYPHAGDAGCSGWWHSVGLEASPLALCTARGQQWDTAPFHSPRYTVRPVTATIDDYKSHTPCRHNISSFQFNSKRKFCFSNLTLILKVQKCVRQSESWQLGERVVCVLVVRRRLR